MLEARYSCFTASSQAYSLAIDNAVRFDALRRFVSYSSLVSTIFRASNWCHGKRCVSGVSLSTAFSLGAAHKLERGAVVSGVVAVHVSLSHGDSEPSLSTKIAAMITSGEIENANNRMM